MRRASPIFLLVAAAAPFLSAPDVHAYSHHETPSGDPIRWTTPLVTVILDSSLSRLGDIEDVRQTVKDAFEVWTDTVSFPFEVEYTDGECDANGAQADGVSCISVAGSPPPGDSAADATTHVRYGASSGSVDEADIVFFEDSGPWSMDGAEDALDLFAVASHEVGHFVGLGHSDVTEARMYPSLAVGEPWAGELDVDDVTGADALYAGVELDDESSAMSCAVCGAPGRPGSALPFAAVLLCFVLARRAKRRV
jgi:hypothetical protein